MSNATRTILVDDHAIMREGLRLILAQSQSVEIVGEAVNGRDAMELVKSKSPDLVVMDVSMADLNGMEATRQIKAWDSTVKVIALSAYADRKYVLGMLEAGASGYVNKGTAGQELLRAIEAVKSGRQYLSAEITAIVVDRCVAQPAPAEPSAAARLGAREREVLQLVAEGKSSKEVASRLNISTRTVEVHRRHIMAKLDLHSAAELTKFAVREGITPLEC